MQTPLVDARLVPESAERHLALVSNDGQNHEGEHGEGLPRLSLFLEDHRRESRVEGGPRREKHHVVRRGSGIIGKGPPEAQRALVYPIHPTPRFLGEADALQRFGEQGVPPMRGNGEQVLVGDPLDETSWIRNGHPFRVHEHARRPQYRVIAMRECVHQRLAERPFVIVGDR